MTRWEFIKTVVDERDVPRVILALAEMYPDEETLEKTLFEELTEEELQPLNNTAPQKDFNRYFSPEGKNGSHSGCEHQ